MRDPDDYAKARAHPRVAGGKAAERLKMFYLARGITEDPAEHSPSDYSAAVLAAIAAAVAAAQSQANLPQWYFLGPDLMANGQSAAQARVSVSGRLSAVAVDPGNRNHLLVGAGAGGIWESFSRGTDWAPRTDFARTLTTGAIAFDPGNAQNNTNIVYAGTGEGNSYWYFGQGILKSTDGGTTWSVLADSPFVGKGFFAIIVDPANPQHLLAATQGLRAVAATATAPAVPATGGVYQSVDGGQNWTQVYAATICWDISMRTVTQQDGTQVVEVLAATSAGLLRSADGGTNWAPVTTLPNYPADGLRRMAVSHSPKDPTVAFTFAAFTNPDPDLSSYPVPYLWRRSGGTWSAIAIPTTTITLTAAGVKKSKTVSMVDCGQASYDWYVAAAPDNTGQVYLGAKDVFRDDLQADGTTWTLINWSSKNPGDDIHSDQHAIAFDPADPATIYCAGDGGLYRSPDRGTTWFSLNPGLGITEIEYMVHDNQNKSWLLAGTQDNGSIRYLGTSVFEHVADGDGGDVGIDQTRTDPTQPPTCYHTYFNTDIERSTTGGGWKSWTDIAIAPPLWPPPPSLFYPPVGAAGSTIAIAGTGVYVSRDTGKPSTWNTVTLPAGEMATALYLPSTDLIYAATMTGRFFTMAYANGAWPAAATELKQPRQAFVSAIRVDPSNRIWVTMTQVGDGTVGKGQVFRSDDQGANWTDKTGYDPDPTKNLPKLPITSIVFDNNNADRVWVSADVGVYQSLDGGTTWAPFFQNLPYVIVEDLEFQPQARVLRAGTRARGVWEVAVDTAGPSVPAPSPKACSVQWNPRGGMEVFAMGTDRTPQHIFQNEPHTVWEPIAGWQGWMPLGAGPSSTTSTGLITITSPLAAGVYQDGRLDVSGRGADGALWHNYQTTPNYDWAGWASLGGLLTGNPVAAANQDGRLEVFARGHDGALWHIAQTAANASTWSAWTSLGGVFLTAPPAAGTAPPVPGASGTITSTPTAALNSDGRLFVFARAIDGTLAIITQTTASSSSSWSAWTSLGGTLAGNPVVQRGQDGHLEVFARGPGGALVHIYQTAPGGTWSAWESLGGTFVGDPAVTPNRDRGMQAWVRWTDNTLWNIWQPGQYGTWSAWNPQPAGGPQALSSDPAGISDQDGSMNVFARGTDNALWQLHQYAPGPQWGSLGGTFTAFPPP
jgi:hypothetical protein